MMRLLNVHSLELETFDHRTAPPYAILSHTWGNDEVDYQVFTSRPESRTGSGWAKILGTCKQAIRDNYGWVWIDTCNIDKSSSAELSEAINSMFVWYQRSAVCYAFLEDVHVEDSSQALEINQLLGTARWFKRGWTLQELIAPQKVVFYSASWDVIGTRDQLRSVLADITGVSERVLQNSAMLSTMSIAQKMFWAANRQTTRVEDIAYCLLGIFGITMPLLYGEGSRAFLRLQEELINRFNDQTIFAWSITAPFKPDSREQDDTAWESLFGGGVLAPHPFAFMYSHDIVQETRLDTASAPTAITTRGILLEAYLRPTNDPTVYSWLLPCSSPREQGRVVVISLKTPSSRTKRYSRIFEGLNVMQYGNEAYMSEIYGYKQIYLKKAVELNFGPTSRICHLSSCPSQLLEPLEGLIVDLDRPLDRLFIENYFGGIQNGRPWDSDSWTADLGTSNFYNGIALTFRFKPSHDRSKYLVVTMAFPGPSLVTVTRYRSTDGPPPLYEILEANLQEAFNSRDCRWIPEIANDIAVKVDADIEYGGIVYKFDVHFEPIKGQADRLVRWEEEGEELKVFADYSIMLATPEERDPKLESFIEEGVIIRE